MTAKRTLIRQAVTTLLTGLPTAGANVFASQLYPLTASQLPAILVTTLDQEPREQYRLANGRSVQIDLTLRIDLVVKKTTGFEDVLDILLDEVLGALFASAASRTLGGLIHPMNEGPVGEPEFDDTTDKPVALLPIRLRVSYTL